MEVFDTLLHALRDTHAAHDGLQAFCAFPTDLTPQPVAPHAIPAARLMADQSWPPGPHDGLRDAFLAAGPQARWRETYKGANIGQDFLDRFGCYTLIGAGGAFHSAQVWAWMVYMPPHLHYTWHHHPGEEIYMVLAGSARFFRQGAPSEVLGPGGTSQHGAHQPHAMETGEDPVMALVLWRNGFDTGPVLTPPENLT